MSESARLVGGVAGVAAGELLAAVTRSVGPTDAVARLVADRIPLTAVELAVFRLHGRDKTALRLTSAAALAALGAGAVGPGRSAVLGCEERRWPSASPQLLCGDHRDDLAMRSSSS